MKNSACVWYLTRKPRVIFTSFLSLLLQAISPMNYKPVWCLLYFPVDSNFQVSWQKRTWWKENRVPLLCGGLTPMFPQSSLSIKSSTKEMSWSVRGWNRWAGEETWDAHKWSEITSWTHCPSIISKHIRNEMTKWLNWIEQFLRGQFSVKYVHTFVKPIFWTLSVM